MSIRRDPFDEMNRILDQMRTATSPTMGTEMGLRGGLGTNTGEFGIGTNLTTESTEDGYLVVADLPGFERSEIDVRFDEGTLTVSAESDVESESEMGRSRRQRRVHEAVRIPGSVRQSDITATYRNGVLEVTLPTEEDGDDGIHVDIE
jgi:HSP20 family protein